MLISPRRRTDRSVELLGWTEAKVMPNLAEWDYGGYEGHTTQDISTTGSALADLEQIQYPDVRLAGPGFWRRGRRSNVAASRWGLR